MADDVQGLLDPAAQAEFARQIAAKRAAQQIAQIAPQAQTSQLRAVGATPTVAQDSAPAAATPTPAAPQMKPVQAAPQPPPQSAEDRLVQSAQQNVEEKQKKQGSLANYIPMTAMPDKDAGFWSKLGHGALRGLEGVGKGVLTAADVAGSIALPGVMMNVPGTSFNRQLQLQAAQGQLGEAEKNRLEASEVEKNKAAATGQTANQKMIADMAAKGYSPVTDATGKTSWQFTGKGEEKVVTDDRQTLPDGTKNPNYGKSVYATLDPQGKPLNYGALAAEPNKPAAAPTAEGVKLQTEDLEKSLAAGTLDQTPGARETLQERQREQKLAGMDSATQAVVAGTYGGQPPVPADYPKGAKDPQYLKDEARWGKIAQEPVGCVVVQSRPMTQLESIAWAKWLADATPDGFFQYITWIPDQPVN